MLLFRRLVAFNFFSTKLLLRICVPIFLWSGIPAHAQTGPGGVGSTATNKIWLDASYMTGLQNNDPVQTWFDRSGNNWHANQSSSLNRPTYQTNKLNGKPAIHFDRTTAPQFVQVTSLGVGTVMSNSQTIFVVSRANTVSAGPADQALYQLVFTTGGGYISGMYYYGYPSTVRNQTITWLGGNGSLPTRYIASSAIATVGGWNLSTQWVNESASSTNLQGFFNGAMHGNVSHATLIANYSAYDNITLGAYTATGYKAALNGDIAEAILFNVALNDAQRIIVDNYLGAKYNISIANDFYHGNDAAYTKDVQGIGTTTGVVTRKNVHASNSRGLQLMELNNSLNATNEFLFAGHASDENSWITDSQLNGHSRWQRTWYLSKNSAIDAKLSFDFSQAGIFPEGDLSTAVSNFRLLYKSTPSGMFSVVQNVGQPLIPTLENSDQLAFSLTSSQLPNGYYTLGYVASLTWTGAVNDQWNNAGNWNMNRVPTSNDFVHINACTTCPTLNDNTTIKGLYLNDQGKLDVANFQLTVLGSASLTRAEVESERGQLQATDFTQIKNSTFKGMLTLHKSGGAVNNCYGGNRFSPGIKITNSSSNTWNITQTADNVIESF